MKPPSQATMQRLCDAFNAAHPIDSTISVWPRSRDVPPVPRVVIEPGAYILGGHTAVVQVRGGCIALSHVAAGAAQP